MADVKLENSSAATKNAIKTICGFDVFGNLEAQVNLRKGLLADLLALTTAGDGEIAVATDFDAIVVYRVVGVDSVGKAFFRTLTIMQAVIDFSPFQFIPTASEVRKQLTVTADTFDRYSLADNVNDVMRVPPELLTMGLDKFSFAFIGTIEALAGARPAGIEITVTINPWLISTGAPYGSFYQYTKAVTTSDGSCQVPINRIFNIRASLLADIDFFAITISHTHTANIPFSGSYLQYSIAGY